MKQIAASIAGIVLAALSAAGCGGVSVSDGGPVGTGITASVVGNVVLVESDAEEPPPSEGVAGIEVSLDQFPEIATRTDAEGNFELDGDFAGRVTLRFRTQDFAATQALEVPTGGVLVLSDIELEPDRVTVEAGRQLGFIGRVGQVDCESGEIILADSRRTTDDYRVALLPETAFVRGTGRPASCDELSSGDRVEIEGLLDSLGERTVTALVVTIDPQDPRPDPVRIVAFLGRVGAIDCEVGLLVIDDGMHRLRLRLSPATEITDPARAPLACEDIALDDRVLGQGALDLRRPALIDARRIVVSERSRPGGSLRVNGFVAGKACERSVLQLNFGGGVLAVRLLPTTVITPPLSCAQIRLGAHVRGRGVPSAELPGAVDARELEVRQRARG